MNRFIVIGGGILGVSTAYHLAKQNKEVLLVDRNDPGQATDAAAGIICPWLSQRRNKAWYTLAKNGAAYYPSLIKQLEQEGEYEVGYSQVGTICIRKEESKLDKLEKIAKDRRNDAPEIGEIKRLSSEETKALFPLLDSDYSSLFVSGGARVDGRAFRNALLNASKKLGAIHIVGDAVLEYQKNKVKGIRVEGEFIPADSVIVTAGAWGKELLLPLGLNFLVTFQKAQILHFGIKNKDTSHWPVVMPPSDQYLLAYDNGRIIAGATHENDVEKEDLRVTAGGIQEVLNKALAIAPALADSIILETRVGFRPFTPGFLPVFGKAPHYQGLFVANGLGSSGLTVGPYLGYQISKMVLDLPLDIDPKLYNVHQAFGTPFPCNRNR
ncbi:FAD-binding oxidoreductase [Bacillaceae bacterium S4-13-58]